MTKVLWLGDSIALHYRPYLEKSLEGVAELSFRQGYREAIADINHPRGTNCGDSSMVAAFLRKLAVEGESAPDWLVFNCGLHDIKIDPAESVRQVERAEYGRNLEEIVELAHARGWRMVWITTTPVDDVKHEHYCPEVRRRECDVATYNALAAEIMAANGVPRIDLHGFTIGLVGEIYCDHVHYVEEVRRAQGEFVAREFATLQRRVANGGDAVQ